MRSDFAILIATNGRADKQITYESLKNGGYTGKVYLVIDDLDEQGDEYRRRYGDSVIVFDKREYAKKVDTMTAWEELRSDAYARLACYDIAERMGLEFFGMFDDDLSSFTFRHVSGGRLLSAPVTDFDSLFESMIGFLETSGATSLGMASCGKLIGGASGVFGNGLGWSIQGATVVRTSDRLNIVGILNWDTNATVLGKNKGQMILEAYAITKNTPARGENGGGLQALYDASREYVREFYSVIVDPSALKVTVKSDGASLRKSNALMWPKILSGRWKKNA